jgi:transcription elongation factor Elf1
MKGRTRHRRRNEELEKLFLCGACGKQYASESAAKKHAQTKHRD